MKEKLKLLVAELLLICAAGLMGLAHWLVDEDDDNDTRITDWRCSCWNCEADTHGLIVCVECREVQ